MKKIFFYLIVALILTSCGCPESSTPHKYDVGQDVLIKNKSSHNTATITMQLRDGDCNCKYEIAYYSTFNTRRHRIVTEGEIEKLKPGMKSGVTDLIGSAANKVLERLK